jgi:hypothetical protein
MLFAESLSLHFTACALGNYRFFTSVNNIGLKEVAAQFVHKQKPILFFVDQSHERVISKQKCHTTLFLSIKDRNTHVSVEYH